jgi:hypothetical protein
MGTQRVRVVLFTLVTRSLPFDSPPSTDGRGGGACTKRVLRVVWSNDYRDRENAVK